MYVYNKKRYRDPMIRARDDMLLSKPDDSRERRQFKLTIAATENGSARRALELITMHFW